MNPLTTKRETPLSESPTAKMLAERRHADVEKRENGPSDVVPRADPPTQKSEVPPGIAQIRPVPTRKPGEPAPTAVPMDSTGELTVPVESTTLKPTEE